MGVSCVEGTLFGGLDGNQSLGGGWEKTSRYFSFASKMAFPPEKKKKKKFGNSGSECETPSPGIIQEVSPNS